MIDRSSAVESAPAHAAAAQAVRTRLGYPDSLLEDLYRRMLRIRLFEEEIHYHISRGHIHGTTHLYIGEEAVAAGAAANLSDLDYITSTHRCHGHAIAKGTALSGLAAEMFGRRAGVCGGKGGSMHLADPARGNLGGTGIVGGGIPIAVGAALSIRRLGQDRIVVCFFGDGAMNEGTFHESVNLAAVWKLPVLFLCENNQYGVSTPAHTVTSGVISDRGAGFGVTSVRVEQGQDVLAVFEAVSAAVDRARAGEGPTLIEAVTYRYNEHSEGLRLGVDYRDQDEKAQWEEMANWRKRMNAALPRAK